MPKKANQKTTKVTKAKAPAKDQKTYVVYYQHLFNKPEPRAISVLDTKTSVRGFFFHSREDAETAIKNDKLITTNTVYWIQECE